MCMNTCTYVRMYTIEMEIGTQEESPISFRLSALIEEPSQNSQSIEESASKHNSIMHSAKMKSKRRLSQREKGKKKMLEYYTNKATSNQNEYEGSMSNDGGPHELRLDLAKRTLRLDDEKLC